MTSNRARRMAQEAGRLAAPLAYDPAPMLAPRPRMNSVGVRALIAGLALAAFAAFAFPEAHACEPGPVGIVVTTPDGNVFVPSTADTCGEAWAGYDATAFPGGTAACEALDLD